MSLNRANHSPSCNGRIAVSAGCRRAGRICARGLSAIELLVTLAITSIVLGIAVPSLAATVRESRVTTAANEMLTVLFYTRTEAIKRSSRVTACTSLGLSACEQTDGWHQGWIVFEDRDDDGVRGPSEPVLIARNGFGGGMLITGNQPVRGYVSYTETGATRLLGGGLQMGTISVCEGAAVRRIIISAAGRPRVVRDSTC